MLCQFCALACLLARTPVAGLVMLELTFTTMWNQHRELVLPVPPGSHILQRAHFCSLGNYFQCHHFTNGNIKTQRSKRLASGHTEEHRRDKRKHRILTLRDVTQAFPWLLYYSMLSPRAPVHRFPYTTAHNELIW